MQVSINVRRTGDTITPAIAAMIRTIGPTGRRRLLTFMGLKFVSMSQSNFGSGGRRFRGNTWPNYSKDYAKRVGSSTPTLYRSGKLKNSIKMQAPRSNYVTVYTMSPYAGIHLFGGRGIPARRYFPMELAGKTLWRLTFNGEKELVNEISRGMTMLSGGVFPRISVATIARSHYEYGNPRTSAQ